MPVKNGHGRFWYDWTPEVWAWSPDMGRWSPGHGRPRAPVSLAVSTDGIEPGEAYDFWRETVFYAFEADKQGGDPAAGFVASVNGLLSENAEFYRYTSDAVSGRRTRRHASADGGDGIDIGLVLSGTRQHEFGSGVRARATPGELFFYDSATPSRVAWDAHRGVHLSLRRRAVEAALGRALPPPEDIARALAGSRQAPLLANQFVLLAGHLDTLDAGARAFMLDQTAQLALYVLGRLGFAPEQSSRFDPVALFAAARQYIERRRADPGLDADAIAAALGCSRATLYRSFAAHEITVAGAIRDMRLAHARALLARGQPGLTNDTLAARCGFESASGFRRAFKARFGMTPQEARQRGADTHS